MPRMSFVFLLCLLAVCTTTSWGLADSSAERVQVNHDIHIEPGDKAADVTCMHCSIYIRGSVAGDATAFGGNIVAYQGAAVAGDVTSLVGDVRVENGAQVAGDLTTLGGTVRRDPQAIVAGDVTSFSGTGWLLLIFLVPLFVFGAIVALIVWLMQRSRRPQPPAAVRAA